VKEEAAVVVVKKEAKKVKPVGRSFKRPVAPETYLRRNQLWIGDEKLWRDSQSGIRQGKV